MRMAKRFSSKMVLVSYFVFAASNIACHKPDIDTILGILHRFTKHSIIHQREEVVYRLRSERCVQVNVVFQPRALFKPYSSMNFACLQSQTFIQFQVCIMNDIILFVFQIWD